MLSQPDSCCMKEAEQRPGTLSLVKMPLNPPRMFLWSDSRNKDGLCACFNSHNLTPRFRSPANQSRHQLCLMIGLCLLQEFCFGSGMRGMDGMCSCACLYWLEWCVLPLLTCFWVNSVSYPSIPPHINLINMFVSLRDRSFWPNRVFVFFSVQK